MKGLTWEWLTDKHWVQYSSELLDHIEKAHLKGDRTLDLERIIPTLPNIMLLDKGYQKNKHSGFVRPVQRRNLSEPYRSVNSGKSVIL